VLVHDGITFFETVFAAAAAPPAEWPRSVQRS